MAVLLIVCVTVVVFWEIMALRSRRPFSPFQTTAEDFRGFRPSSSQWLARPVPVRADPVEPNILVYEVRRAGAKEHADTPVLPYPDAHPVLVRLVHGYNMRDCMRMKGYQVELAGEARSQESEGTENMGQGTTACPPKPLRRRDNTTTQQLRNSTTDVAHPVSSSDFPPQAGPSAADRSHPSSLSSRHRQVWRLTSSTGEVSIWITGMVRAGDFSETDADVRSMAFPRISIPDDPRWLPSGITWKSLCHPIANFQLFLREKWNSSRCDLATFLGLRHPAWASDELLTVVASWRGPSVERNEEQLVTEHVLAAYDVLYAGLKAWRTQAEIR